MPGEQHPRAYAVLFASTFAFMISFAVWMMFGVIGIPLVEAGANFTLPLKFGDEAELVSTVTALGRSSFGLQHRIYQGETLAVDGREKRVWAGPHPDDPSRMRAIAIPDDVRARLAADS